MKERWLTIIVFSIDPPHEGFNGILFNQSIPKTLFFQPSLKAEYAAVKLYYTTYL
jgi:hypothetical protein